MAMRSNALRYYEPTNLHVIQHLHLQVLSSLQKRLTFEVMVGYDRNTYSATDASNLLVSLCITTDIITTLSSTTIMTMVKVRVQDFVVILVLTVPVPARRPDKLEGHTLAQRTPRRPCK